VKQAHEVALKIMGLVHLHCLSMIDEFAGHCLQALFGLSRTVPLGQVQLSVSSVELSGHLLQPIDVKLKVVP